jgi:L-fuconolactonase
MSSMIIDAHQHFWQYDPRRHGWITDSMSVLKRDFLPADLTRELQHSGVIGTIAVQAETSLRETEFLLELARASENILGVVGWIDLTSADIIEQLRLFAGRTKLCGFRHMVQDEPDDRYLLREDVLRGIRAIGDAGFPYDLLLYPRQLPAAIELVSRLPNQQFVLDHCAKPFIKTRKFEPWATHIRELARFPYVCCKLSGLVTEADWHSWQPADLRPYVDLVVEAFTPSRLMFGSDWPVCLLAGDYRAVKNCIESYAQQFSPQDRALIFGGVAARFYGFKDLAT